MSIAHSTLLTSSLADVDLETVARLDTRRYAAQYLERVTAESLPWQAFAERLPTLFAGPSPGRDLEMLAVRKSVTWSNRDFNVYVGSGVRRVRSFLDLTNDEFTRIFAWHIALARVLACSLERAVHVTHGFNPEDIAPDAHSLPARFHTHVHVPQEHGRRSVSLGDLSTFDQLALIEPFSEVFFDMAAASFAAGGLGSSRPERRIGFFTMPMSGAKTALGRELGLLHAMLCELNRACEEVTSALTDGSEETATGCARKVPRPQDERIARMAGVVRANDVWLSERSARLLWYLASHLRAAEPRESPRSTRITRGGQMWLAKGFSGALNFVVSGRSGGVRCDFAPRIVSTSGAAKVIGPGTTLVFKDQGTASAQEQELMEEFLIMAAGAARAVVMAHRSEGGGGCAGG